MADSRGDAAAAGAALTDAAAFRKLLDPETKWVRPRNDDGSWLTPFDPALDETGFQEGNSWQYSWLVSHDARGLFDLMGGDAAAVERLDTHFSEAVASKVPVASPRRRAGPRCSAWSTGPTSTPPERARPADLLDVRARRRPSKVQSVQRQIQGAFRPTVDGLPGNDDLGSLSPGTSGAPSARPGHARRAALRRRQPVFERAELDLPGKKDVVIEAPGASLTGKYVQSASLGGAPLDRSWVTHRELRKGGTLRLEMGAQPSSWAAAGARPPSVSDSPLSAFGCAP
jgi:putative alpha-1,2-mannosidase